MAPKFLAPLLRCDPTTGAVVVAAVRGDEHAVVTGGTGVDADTRFELGSVTKTFTALLLADAVARNEVRLDDPLAAFLPPGARPRGAPPITLLHLATHTSGLPRLPRGSLRTALPAWYSNPYAGYDEKRLFDSLGRTPVRTRPGSRVTYSNLGVGLLGHVLARAADMPYADLIVRRLGVPLGLVMTTCDPNAPQVTGYLHGRPRPPWDMPGLPAAGALRSTAADLTRYLAAHLTPGGVASPALAAALREVRRPRLIVRGSGDRLGLVWNVRERPGHELVFHGGSTRGFTSFVGFSPQAGVAVAALANTAAGPRATFVQSAYEALRALAADTMGG
ncbi:serine hydrolase domain-containing protein [Streptomyces sp. SID3343]|uniref:serine hydrolase domain-containing protein n=1 Tax=Streptomyces sp. SID3343 TaxID=2690260 RepID=UPI001368F79C|nr:serine hydrolase domain-containing protein [Streptomyces sp. SID3343]MYW01318.1 serine hydrolase [Streptomyces sp. SID3343]